MSIRNLIESLEEEILDPEEETFFLFSQPIPSANLGFVDPKASELDITVNGRDYTIHQSPAVLASNREGGTTGAVLWKITPLFASWLAAPSNPFLPPKASVLELGCGISALTALVAAPRVSRYILTDQPYVQRFVQQNLEENATPPARHKSKKQTTIDTPGDLRFTPLDWELDEVTPALTCTPGVTSFDLVVACDCIYNDALIAPLVQACADVCRLRHRDATAGDEAKDSNGPSEPCVCVVAQQLRSPEVFEGWLKAFHEKFRVWRVPDEMLDEGLRVGSGFAVHVGILREVYE
ncbi:hypothetical protein F5X68DRAFT_261099 [Plectosphaerella plurivora]|uniref:Diaminohydroxyphosphoribosylamino-pyrimidine deaminase n=1 Tax=Plectosphaerella plurivora TaxID=936078 RepID=A0A9P9A8S7_9PEZI|nr:hypothetical protein F5X68DRAFT_261099 [Plectosphaerella plurivora]